METSFKEQCIALRKEGCSIIEIMRITGRAKTSIYFHIQDIPLSAKRLLEIKKASGEHIRKFAIARKGKSTREYKVFDVWSVHTVLLVSHLSFDGGLRHGVTEYNNRSEALIQRVKTLMQRVYSYEPSTTINALTGVYRISYFNVALSNFLKEKSKELISRIEYVKRSCKREFLRAFFDDEGCMDFRPHRNIRRIRGYQKDTKVLYIVQSLLAIFAIQSHIEMPNEVVISGQGNLRRFQKEINFSKGVRINGNRSNSIWKESLEKRELLDRAIKSFKT